MSERRLDSMSLGRADAECITRFDIAAIPEPERSVVETDLPRIRSWLRRHPGVDASVTLDRTAFDAGQGHVLVIVAVTGDPTEVREDLESAVLHPDRLRVHAHRPSLNTLREVLQLVLATRMTADTPTTVTSAGIDERAGKVVVTLNRRDEAYAAKLMSLTKGLIRVARDPVIVTPLGPSDP